MWRMQLVDRDGNLLTDPASGIFTYGCDSVGDKDATFVFAPLDASVTEVYLAPFTAAGADMTQAVRVL